MKTDNIDLGKYDLNQLLRNPGLIHKIQDNLMALKHNSLLGEAIRQGAKKNVKSCIKMIVGQIADNPRIMEEIVGKETIDLINEFIGKETESDIPETLFRSQGIAFPDKSNEPL